MLINKLLKKVRFSSVRRSSLHSTVKINSGSSLYNCSMDRYSYCGYDCTLINVDVGAFCSIAGRVNVGSATHPMHFVSTSPVFLSHKDSIKRKFHRFDYLPEHRTIIGSDVWIGEGAFVKAGLTIGVGAVIGMGAVVTKNVPPYAIVAGNPAVIIRMRFSDEVVASLLQSEWWTQSDEEIASLAKYFDDPLIFLKRLSGL